MQRRALALLVALVCFVLFSLLGGWRLITELVLHLGYVTRPLWDSATISDPSHTIIPNFGYVDDSSCAAHGFTVRAQPTALKIWDIFLFANEVDMLEIRSELELPYIVLTSARSNHFCCWLDAG